MKKYIIDCESNGLLKQATKIHCLCYQDMDGSDVVAIIDYDEMREFLSHEMIMVGHMMVRYDKPLLEKLLEITIPWKAIDTLALSWYLEPERAKHGLESYSEEMGIEKPKIENWEGQSVDSYIFRCSSDVKINKAVWKKQYRYLIHLYEDENKLNRFLAYIQFKLECIREQEEIGIKLDVEHCQSMLYKLEREKEAKIKELIIAMPPRALIDVRNRPKIMEKKDGSLSSHGEKWWQFLREMEIEGNPESVEYIRDWEPGNPNSHDQVKKWLYSLGWEPQNIKHVRDKKKNTVKKIPQIASKEGGGEICDSIKMLFDKEPKLELLAGLTILTHRIGLFSGFLRDQEDGRLYQTISGLASTLRKQHSVIVNLPTAAKRYGEEVRACLISDDGCILMGADLKNIESKTRNHYMYPFDGEYVKQIEEEEGFDSHLDIAVLAGLMTEDESNFYKWFSDR